MNNVIGDIFLKHRFPKIKVNQKDLTLKEARAVMITDFVKIKKWQAAPAAER